ncbi:MutS-related protein [Butyrivibrio sp. NC2002]|uniref:MutS-related protein n=1 Tax=Butyrivibrio sp. NC2002 TaxID=1410610 RepID=UPI000561C749|nr:hypothetical protein [Butyrivibrio sp. NC2002]
MNGIIFIAIIATVLLLVFLIGKSNEKTERERFIKQVKNEFGKAPSKRLKTSGKGLWGYHLKHRNDYFVDDITFSDLSLSDVFDRINYCESDAGEEYLYYLIRNPKIGLSDETGEFEEHVSDFITDEDLRLKYKQIFHSIGKNFKYSIYEYLDFLDKYDRESNFVHFLLLALMAVSLIIMCAWNFTFGFLLLLCTFAYNIVSYFRIKAQIDPYISTFAYVCRLLRMAKKVSDEGDERFKKENDELLISCKNMEGFIKGSWVLMSPSKMNGSGNPIDVLMDYVRMLTHVDIIKFNKMFDSLKKEIASVDKMISIMGRIDAELSVSYFRASLQNGYSIPDLTENGSRKFAMEDGYHPLIDVPVKNTILSDRGILITGSNASGKSTFLKTCAINAILSQSINTALASKYAAPFYRVYSSMALRDDLRGGDSYYMVEIKSLKRILDAKDGKAPVLCFIDEVLRGTNTVERISASAKILEYFAESDVYCIAATHDVELSQLLKECFDIYHFEGIMKGDDVEFDYLLKEGPATTRNAINLLKVIGYDEKIVTDAENMAKRFEESGIWSL